MEALAFNVSPAKGATRYVEYTFAGCHLLTLVLSSQISAGYLEGIVRGYKAGLLSQGQYNNLTQCENLEGEPTRSAPRLTI